MDGADDERMLRSILAAPAGVALLAGLEGHRGDGRGWFATAVDSDPEAVARAVDDVGASSFGALVSAAVEAAAWGAGPWMPDAPMNLARAYAHAGARRPIARALVERYGDELDRDIDVGAQQWWHATEPSASAVAPRFTDFDDVYGNGEFTFAGLWTVTDPPAEVHVDLVDAWEMDRGPVSRWHLPVSATARVWEIHDPTDWARLVETYPRVADRPHGGWELPGPNQHDGDVDALLTVAGQHAARRDGRRHVLPDWAAVADDYDGVHLSWAGFITTEGHVSDLGDDRLTMLRYWASERTLWLADVFATPVPEAAPMLSGMAVRGVDVGRDQDRQRQDRAVLRALLAR